MKPPKLPVIQIRPQGPREGALLPLPHDFEQPKFELLKDQERIKTTQQLLDEEAAHLRSIGLTWEELQYYQGKLTDGTAIDQAPETLHIGKF